MDTCSKHVFFSHRITEWLGLEGASGSSGPTSLFNRVVPEHMAQDCSQIARECLSKGSLLASLLQILTDLQEVPSQLSQDRAGPAPSAFPSVRPMLSGP